MEVTLHKLMVNITYLTDVISLECIPRCVNLWHLDLSGNHLSAVGELAVLVHLQHLNLSDNKISELGQQLPH